VLADEFLGFVDPKRLTACCPLRPDEQVLIGQSLQVVTEQLLGQPRRLLLSLLGYRRKLSPQLFRDGQLRHRFAP
jgi:hypothetical protein